MHYSVTFEPLLPAIWLALLFALPALFILAGLLALRRGSLLRLLTLAMFLIALLNPVFLREEREPVKSTLAVIIDRSQSQKFGKRTQDTDMAVAALEKALAAYPQFEARFIEAAKTGPVDDNIATRLLPALEQGLADIPPSRIAGAILVTDGQVHELPEKTTFPAPINALITGEAAEYDRRIRFAKTPRFGLAGKRLELAARVEDYGVTPQGGTAAHVTVLVNGTPAENLAITPGEEKPFTVTLPHAGRNIIEIITPPVAGELTDVNNHAVIMVDGVRENLKVLLVSGEPHNGLRAWRDLLKSDTGVDLVHFTILRPPEKQDNTPLHQLSLITFPTTELFVDKIHDFDLVIFDRYQHYDVLPLIYYDYIAQYVKGGGALLIATGPEFADQASLAATPLLSAIPAIPTGQVIEKPFLPRLTAEGQKHPVTRNLDNSGTNPPHWGRWLRQIEAKPIHNAEILMQGDHDRPLMLLSRIGKGRVGMLLSDQGWLWARGYEGGGPYAALYRRMAHWLMKEPELEEEALFATSNGNRLTIRRQTMKDKADPAHIQLPSGKTVDIPLKPEAEGTFTASYQSDETGLIRIEQDGKTAVAHIGPFNAPEYGDIISTTGVLKPLAALTGGHVMRLHQQAGEAISIGAIAPTRQPVQSSDMDNSRRLILKESSDTRLIATERLPLFSGFPVLLAGLLLFAATWWREGKR